MATKTRRKKTPADLNALAGMLEAGEGDLLGEVAAFIREYVVMTPAQVVATALWVVHTHAVELAEQTPYLVITSPEKQCGKTRLMEVLALLVARPWPAIVPSEAVIYRNVDRVTPTLLLDEIDTVFNPRSADKHEHLRALINAGNRRGTKVPRCVGQAQKIVEFDVYSAKALAGIGTLPDTITDRSLPIRLKRRGRGEKIVRLRRRAAEPQAEALRERVAEWAEAQADRLERARPTAPDGLSDRMQDACEPLLAIADRVGGPWPSLARQALVELATGERVDDVGSMRVRLLRDIKAIFEADEKPDRRAMTTERLLSRLVGLPDGPWGSWYGRGLESRDLASLLRHFGIRPANLRVGKEKDQVRKGYRRRELQDAWERYA